MFGRAPNTGSISGIIKCKTNPKVTETQQSIETVNILLGLHYQCVSVFVEAILEWYSPVNCSDILFLERALGYMDFSMG